VGGDHDEMRVIELTEDERTLLLVMVRDKEAHARRCAERCLKPNRPDTVKADGARWRYQAETWQAIAKKLN
jgi:hypothetical protein